MANEEHLAILKQGVEAWNQWREENPEIQPDLSEASLSGADLSKARLHKAALDDANLLNAILSGANLSKAYLFGTNLANANLSGADLSEADLGGTNLFNANLEDADLTKTNIGWTTFGNVDLSRVIGLETIQHIGPSTIGIDTIYRSKGNIPESFLRDTGVPDNFIEYMRSLTGEAIEYYSCFISYSSNDEDLAQRLHNDLQAAGVRCWYAPHDMPIGAPIDSTIDRSIRMHEKVLLILSEHSVASSWVKREVRMALAQERMSDSDVLFPIRVDDAVMQINEGWPAHIRNTRHIGDFTQWKDHHAYQAAFERLLEALKASDSA